jgi:mercuric ion binding protein
MAHGSFDNKKERVMKKWLVAVAPLLVSALFVPSFGSLWASEPSMEIVQLSVPSMHCELCPFTVRSALERLPGVLKATASLSSKTATVWIEEGKARRFETLDKRQKTPVIPPHSCRSGSCIAEKIALSKLDNDNA